MTCRISAVIIAFVLCMIAIPQLDYSFIRADAAFSESFKWGYQPFTQSYTYGGTGVTSKIAAGAPSGVSVTSREQNGKTTFTVKAKYPNTSSSDKNFSVYIMKNGSAVKELQFTQTRPICDIRVNGSTDIKAHNNSRLTINITANGPVSIWSIYRNDSSTPFSDLYSQDLGSYRNDGSTYSRTVTISFKDNYTDSNFTEVWGIQVFSNVRTINLYQDCNHSYSNGKITLSGVVPNEYRREKIWKANSSKWSGWPISDCAKTADLVNTGIKIEYNNNSTATAYIYYSLESKYSRDDYETLCEILSPDDEEYPGPKWRKFATIDNPRSSKMVWHNIKCSKTEDPSLSNKLYSTTFKEV